MHSFSDDVDGINKLSASYQQLKKEVNKVLLTVV